MSVPTTPALRPLKILVVDDAPTNRQILSVFLGKLGHSIITAEDGFQAVEKFSTLLPDLVLMDVMMPGMDGYEATRRIKAQSGERWAPVIFLSALDKDENLVAGLDAGGDDYLTKPINFVVLDAKICSVSRTLDMQRNLDAARKQMASISDNIVDGVITMDTSNTIRWASHSAHAIFGYEAGALIGRPVVDLMPAALAELHDQRVADYVASGTPKVIGLGPREARGRRQDGREFPVEIGITEMLTEGERTFVAVVRDISERKMIESRLRTNAERLQKYYDDQEREYALAQEVMSRVMTHPALVASGVEHWVAAANHFSGDVVAAFRREDGKLFVMLADATGHGLAAAISALPLLSSFYGVVAAGGDFPFSVSRLNQQLRALLPSGRFVAATILCLDEAAGGAQVWQAGMPDLIQMSAEGSVKRCLPSSHLPLGVVDVDEATVETESLHLDWDAGDQFVLFSDGLIEATNRDDEAYGVDRLKLALSGAPPDGRLDAARASLKGFLGLKEAVDDVSLLLVNCHLSPTVAA